MQVNAQSYQEDVIKYYIIRQIRLLSEIFKKKSSKKYF